MNSDEWNLKLSVGNLNIVYSGTAPSDIDCDEHSKLRLEFIEMVTALFNGQTSFEGLL